MIRGVWKARRRGLKARRVGQSGSWPTSRSRRTCFRISYTEPYQTAVTRLADQPLYFARRLLDWGTEEHGVVDDEPKFRLVIAHVASCQTFAYCVFRRKPFNRPSVGRYCIQRSNSSRLGIPKSVVGSMASHPCVAQAPTLSPERPLAERVAEIVGHAATNGLFISVIERHLLHIGVVWLGAEWRKDFGLIAGNRARDEQSPSLIRHLRFGRGLIGLRRSFR